MLFDLFNAHTHTPTQFGNVQIAYMENKRSFSHWSGTTHTKKNPTAKHPGRAEPNGELQECM